MIAPARWNASMDDAAKWEVLMNGQQPEGGDWNFDASNRRSCPKGAFFLCHMSLPTTFRHWSEIEDGGGNHRQSGCLSIQMAARPAESLELLDVFCAELLPYFGDFQDAMTPGGWSLYHSRISFALNCKMLTPLEVIRRVESEYRKRKERDRYFSIRRFHPTDPRLAGKRTWDLLGAHARICATQHDHQRALPNGSGPGIRDGLFIDAINHPWSELCPPHSAPDADGEFCPAPGHPSRCCGLGTLASIWTPSNGWRYQRPWHESVCRWWSDGHQTLREFGELSTRCRITAAAAATTEENRAGCLSFNALYWDFFDRNASALRKIRGSAAYRNLDRMDPTQRAALFEHAEWIRSNIDRLKAKIEVDVVWFKGSAPPRSRCPFHRLRIRTSLILFGSLSQRALQQKDWDIRHLRFQWEGAQDMRHELKNFGIHLSIGFCGAQEAFDRIIEGARCRRCSAWKRPAIATINAICGWLTSSENAV